ncbi:hypothetical protein [Yoonia algicola]|uniref:Uncharacterized protein n=1 Tax=Yoonia algicola TaxID=3137368 RepID=A0AAN0M5T5_9RHOB
MARLADVTFCAEVSFIGLTDAVGASESNRHLKVWFSNTAEDQTKPSKPQGLQALTY